MKKGLSAVITVLILISLALIITAGIFVWMKSSSSSVQKEADIDQLCSEIIFSSGDFCYNKQMIYNVETETEEEATNLKFSIRNDIGSQEIYGFLISLTDFEGNSRTISTLPFNEVGKQEAKQLITDFISNTDNIDLLKIIPELNYSNKIIVCNGQAKNADWGQIKEC